MTNPVKYYPHYRDQKNGVEQEPLPVTIMAEDEVHFYQGTTIIHKWSLKGKQPTLFTPPGRNKIGYFGAVDLLTGKLITMPEEQQFTQYTFKEFLELLLRYTHCKVILSCIGQCKMASCKTNSAICRKA